MGDRIAFEPLPPREALAYFRSKGYADALQRFDYRDVWREEHARHFVVAKAMKDDVLQDIRAALDAALAEGQTLDQFRDALAPELRRKGWWGKSVERDPLTGELKEVRLGSMHRLRVIFDTNLTTSYAAGRWARLQRNKALFPYLEYRQLQRETAREAHKPFHGLILPIDHPLWQRIFPPNGWFCACDVVATNARRMEREGKTLTTEAELAELAMQDWINPRTGQSERLLEGIDPAFAANPGAAWEDIADRHESGRLGLPDSHAAYDRGFARELAALALRDERPNALLYDLDSDPGATPIGMTRGDLARWPAPLSADMRAAIEAPESRNVLLRAGAELPFPGGRADLEEMTLNRGLAQIVATAPDGSVFRVEPAPGLDDAARLNMLALIGEMDAALEPDLDALGLSAAERDLVVADAIAQALADRELVAYGPAPSGRAALLLERAADIVARAISGLSG